MTVAALYVDPDGPYADMPNVDPWPMDRDAKLYAGPHPVVAHPPCGPWGQFWWRCTEQDRVAALVAVVQVRTWGGVLEHPAGSLLWREMHMPTPGGQLDWYGGWTLRVDQVDWGHKCVKPTWLYIVGTTKTPPMPEKRQPTHRISQGDPALRDLPKSERHLTPPAFARWLTSVAKGCTR